MATKQTLVINRTEYFKSCHAESFQNPIRQLFNYFGGVLFKNVSYSERKHMTNDLSKYYKDGVAFAEEVLGLPVTNLKLVNSTFIVRSDGVYNLPCNFIPYRCFFFSYRFSPKNLKNLNYSDFSLLVKDDDFTNHPLLANSVQLFSIWVRSCAEILSQCQHNILFTFQCCDALEFCQQLHKPSAHLPQQFDAIYASNLLDYVSPLSLVLLAMPILKSNGSLFTTVLSYFSESNTSTEYLEKQFGFKCKFLQLLCGVRCIGYENEYSDSVSIKPLPYNHNIDIVLGVHTKFFVWRHVTGMPLKQVTEEHFVKMWRTLNDSIIDLLTCHHDYKNCNCTGTVMILLQSFASRFESEYSSRSYQFWQPLCSLLLKQKSLQCFITSLQTQAFLHDLHLHLTVLETDCPLCNNRPVLQSIKGLSFTVHTKLSDFFAPGGKELKFSIAICHNSLTGVVNDQSWLSQYPKHFSDNLHIIDTIHGKITTEEKLEVTFFSPIDLIQKDYFVLLVSSNKDLIVHKEMSGCKAIDRNIYCFCKSIKPCFFKDNTQFSLGVVLQHSGDEKHFESIVSLSDVAITAIKKYQLTTERCSHSTIRIKINKIFTDISYPYSVQYDKIVIKLSRSQGRITVLAYRTCHCVYDEDPVFIVNPVNVLSLPIMPISKNDAISFCKSQRLPPFSSYSYSNPGQDELDLKQSILHLFKRPEIHFCCIDRNEEKVRQIKCLVVVLNRIFDLQNKVPALDILYCNSTESMSDPFIHLGFMPKIVTSEPISVWVNQAETQLSNKILDYFAKSTMATSMPIGNATYKRLVNHGIHSKFSRAVIYPLYPNLDQGTAGPLMCAAIGSCMFGDTLLPDVMGMQPPYWLRFLKAVCFEEDKCSYCKHHKEYLKKCSRCRLVQYCNRDCQKKHWQAHKLHCTDPQ